MNKIKFYLDGCDISFIAEAPEDITLKQLLKQCDRIKEHWCRCGIHSLENFDEMSDVELIIDYDNITKTSEDVSCDILDKVDKKDISMPLEELESYEPQNNYEEMEQDYFWGEED